MRIIPKKTKVAMEFFKGVEVPDVIVGIIGISIVISVVFSNLPFRFYIGAAVGVLWGVGGAGGRGEGVHDAVQLPEIPGQIPAVSDGA